MCDVCNGYPSHNCPSCSVDPTPVDGYWEAVEAIADAVEHRDFILDEASSYKFDIEQLVSDVENRLIFNSEGTVIEKEQI